MRRRVFLEPEFIALAENFVCVRMNAWLDEVNVNRTRRMLGWHQNTALALVRPDAKGVSIDSFPATEECYWQLYADTKGTKEGETLQGAEEILPAMVALADMITPKAVAEDELPRLPVHPDIKQTVNLGACDSRMVVVQVDGEEDIEPKLRALVFDEELAGTAHYVRASSEEWQTAIDEGLIEVDGPTLEAGLFVVRPESFGRSGDVLAQAPVDATSDELRTCLVDGLELFREQFHKLDRSQHFLVGLRDSIFWEEHRVQPVGSGSSPMSDM